MMSGYIYGGVCSFKQRYTIIVEKIRSIGTIEVGKKYVVAPSIEGSTLFWSKFQTKWLYGECSL